MAKRTSQLHRALERAILDIDDQIAVLHLARKHLVDRLPKVAPADPLPLADADPQRYPSIVGE